MSHIPVTWNPDKKTLFQSQLILSAKTLRFEGFGNKLEISTKQSDVLAYSELKTYAPTSSFIFYHSFVNSPSSIR